MLNDLTLLTKSLKLYLIFLKKCIYRYKFCNQVIEILIDDDLQKYTSMNITPEKYRQSKSCRQVTPEKNNLQKKNNLKLKFRIEFN